MGKREAPDMDLLGSVLRHMKDQGLTVQQLITLYEDISPKDSVPVSIFAQSIPPSQALCNYLHRQRGLSFRDISLLLNRDQRSIWTSCNRRVSDLRTPEESGILIPLSIFKDRSMSILEHVVNYLRAQHSLTNSGIAKLLNKNPSSIITVAKRIEQKMSGRPKMKRPEKVRGGT